MILTKDGITVEVSHPSDIARYKGVGYSVVKEPEKEPESDKPVKEPEKEPESDKPVKEPEKEPVKEPESDKPVKGKKE